MLQEALRQMAGLNSTAGILARQREAMAAIQSGFTDWPVPAPAELEEARASLARNLPETPEQIKEVGQLAEAITDDPEQRKLIERVTGTLKKADLSRVPRVVIPVALYWFLCTRLGLPLNGAVAEARSADYLGVITIVLMVLFYLWPSG